MKIAFCGDLVLRSPENHKIGSRLKSILDSADIRILNFEVPVKIQDGIGIHKSGPVHCQSAQSPAWVKKNCFNLITLANNHSLDYGEPGLKATLKAFEDIKITGIGTFDSAYEVTVIEKKGQKIGFLGLSHKEFGCVDEYSGNRLGTAMATSPRVYSSIVRVRPSVDKLYILPHAGVEYMDIPLPEWREVYKSYIDLGADGVIASHPHVPQGWEIYNGCPIFYSLGNFLFEVPDPSIRPKKWLNSIMVIVNTDDEKFESYPLFYDYQNKTVEVDNNKDSMGYLNYLTSLLEPDKYSGRMNSYLRELDKRYEDMMILGGACSMKFKEKIKNVIKPFLGRKKRVCDPIHLLNLFQCESHRWTMMRLLGRKLNRD